ncbi:MAG TPA: hypothetical protein VGP72_05705 [Planctomycetota bacterium]|jgi:hypothetical protein
MLSEQDTASTTATTPAKAASLYFDGLLASRWAILLFLLLGILPGIGCLTAPLLMGYDDNWVTRDNPLIVHGLSSIGKQFMKPFGPVNAVGFETGHWAPLTYLSFALDHLIFDGGGDFTPWVLRLITGVYHGVCGWLVFLLAQRLLTSAQRNQSGLAAPLAFFVALIFLFHPTVCESVCWVVERNNVLPALFGLWSVYVFTGDDDGEPGWGRMFCAFLLLLLSQLFKASGVIWWPVMVGWDFLLLRGKVSTKIARATLLLLPVLLSLYVIRRSHADTIMPPLGEGWLDRGMHSVALQLRYFGLLVWPVDLSAFYHVSPVQYGWFTAPFCAILAGTTAVLILLLRMGMSWRHIGLYLLWIAAAVAPMINPLVITSFPLQDRYLYPATPAFGLLLAQATLLLVARYQSSSQAAAVGRYTCLGAAALCALFLVGSISRSFAWRDQQTLFSNAARNQPDSAFGHSYFATNCFFASQDVRDAQQARRLQQIALAEHKKAIACDDFERLPWPFHYVLEQARLSFMLGELDRGRELCLRVADGRPERATESGTKVLALKYLAFDAKQQKDLKAAREFADRALALAPDDAELRAMSADINREMKK